MHISGFTTEVKSMYQGQCMLFALITACIAYYFLSMSFRWFLLSQGRYIYNIYDIYNRNNSRKVLIEMVIDWREGKSNTQAVVPSDLFGEISILLGYLPCWHFHRIE